jgi:hypothetical protein
MEANEVAAQFAAVQKEVTLLPQLTKMLELLAQQQEFLISERAKVAEKERLQDEAFQHRERQIIQNNKDWNRGILAKQKKCQHMKGYWKQGLPTPGHIDYAVYMHTFINMKREIKCRICKMTWRPEDTKDFLVINGEQLPNHTGIGWEDAINGRLSALAMTANSTDKPSASEAPLTGVVSDEVTNLLQGRPPDFIAQLLSSPEGRAFLERTAKKQK